LNLLRRIIPTKSNPANANPSLLHRSIELVGAVVEIVSATAIELVPEIVICAGATLHVGGLFAVP
jgi:hypothetical protein